MSTCSYIGGSGGLLNLTSRLKGAVEGKHYWLAIADNRRGFSISSCISSYTCLVQLAYRDLVELNKLTTAWEGYVSVAIKIMY